MGYSSPVNEQQQQRGSKDMTMPSSNFSSKVRRFHSGRITENSDSWLQRPDSDAGRGSPREPLCNSENYRPSRGKKVGLAKEDDVAKRLIRRDSSDPMPRPATQRKNDFPTHPQAQRFQMELERHHSPRAPPVKVQHCSSPELVAVMKPEATQGPVSRRIMVGEQLVDWSSSGRRAALVCQQHVPTAMSPRDHRSSTAVRDHLQGPAAVGAPMKQGFFPAPLLQTSHCVYTSGTSCLPSTMPKDTAYLQTGTSVTKYSPRAPGAFSPNVARMPIGRFLQAQG